MTLILSDLGLWSIWIRQFHLASYVQKHMMLLSLKQISRVPESPEHGWKRQRRGQLVGHVDSAPRDHYHLIKLQLVFKLCLNWSRISFPKIDSDFNLQNSCFQYFSSFLQSLQTKKLLQRPISSTALFSLFADRCLVFPTFKENILQTSKIFFYFSIWEQSSQLVPKGTSKQCRVQVTRPISAQESRSSVRPKSVMR